MELTPSKGSVRFSLPACSDAPVVNTAPCCPSRAHAGRTPRLYLCGPLRPLGSLERLTSFSECAQEQHRPGCDWASWALLPQVTEEVHRLLRRRAYHFSCRGKVSVKGKGEMLTYFLEGRTDGNGPQTRPLSSERRTCLYGRAGLQTGLATGCPWVGAGPGALQGSGVAPQPPGPHLPPAAAGKEA